MLNSSYQKENLLGKQLYWKKEMGMRGLITISVISLIGIVGISFFMFFIALVG